MRTHRLINISIALAGALLFATVLSASQLLGPDDIETERQQLRNLQEAKRQAQQQARFDKAAQARDLVSRMASTWAAHNVEASE
jgi:hypothetical protein